MRMLKTAVAAAALALAPVLGLAEEVTPRHGIAMHGDPKYGPDFTHFDYVNPDAPKGGTVRLSAIGTFDSFNPYIAERRRRRRARLSLREPLDRARRTSPSPNTACIAEIDRDAGGPLLGRLHLAARGALP